MDVIATSPNVNTATTNTAQVNEEANSSSSALASDFETFLRLLTTQLENQDPSKPLDSTEFVAQLASFSAVEQQINTNTKLDELIGQVKGGMTADLSSWIGADVRSDAPTHFKGLPIEAFFTIPQSANSAQLIVQDSAGIEVDRRAIDITSTKFEWDGIDASLTQLPDGDYRFQIEAFEDTVSLGVQPAQSFSPVKETRLTDGVVELVFSDGSKMAAADVVAVRGG